MCIKNTHFKCLKSYYRISGVEVTHLFLECIKVQIIHIISEMESRKVALSGVLSDLKDNKNSQSYGSDLDSTGKNYFGNDSYLF